MSWIALWIGSALAGGPWVASPGAANVYVGTDLQRIERLADSRSNLDPDGLTAVGQGLSKLYVKGLLSYGVAPHTDVTVELPVGWVRSNRPDDPLCDALGGDSCAETKGLAPIVIRARRQLLDELYGAPLSLSVGVEVRHGLPTAATRKRLTNLGEGTDDFGLVLSAGRSGGLGSKGYYYVFGDVFGRYRLPSTRAGGVAVPGAELGGELDFVAVPDGRVGIGPALLVFGRPSGVDFEQIDLADPDRFGALRVVNLAAGVKAQVGTVGGATLNLSVFQSFYVVNNPLVFSCGLGVSWVDPFRHRRDEDT